MWALSVIPRTPRTNRGVCLGEIVKGVLPHAFFFQAPKEALNHPILFRRVGRNEFLLQLIELARHTKAPTLDD